VQACSWFGCSGLNEWKGMSEGEKAEEEEIGERGKKK